MSTDNNEPTQTQIDDATKALAEAKIEKDSQTLEWPSFPKWPSNFKSPGSDLKHAQSTGGSSATVVYGNFYKYMDGDSFVSTDGNSWGQTLGNSFSLSCGSSESFKLSNDFSATLGGSESVSLGALNMSFTGTVAKLGVTWTGLEASFSRAERKFEITKSPKVYGIHEGKVIETAAKGLSYTAATGGIKFNAGEGDISNTAVTGNIINGAAKNIENISAEGDIISKAVTGGVIIEALEGITLKCGANSISISEDGIQIISSTKVEVGLASGQQGMAITNSMVYLGNGPSELTLTPSAVEAKPMVQAG